jgi:hypothetical protein
MSRTQQPSCQRAGILVRIVAPEPRYGTESLISSQIGRG